MTTIQRLVALMALFAEPACTLNIQQVLIRRCLPKTVHGSAKAPIDLNSESVMRSDLKQGLLRAADEFKVLQEEIFATKAVDKAKRINKKRGRDGLADDERINGLFGASSIGAIEVDLGEKGREVIDLAERLSAINPTEIPTFGWLGYGSGSPVDCPLNGVWKLRFTSGKDATFAESPIRGKANTSQVVSAFDGTLINKIAFEKGKVKGFDVVVEGKATSNDEMDLIFKRVIIHRKSRFPRFLSKITIRLPSFKFLSAIAKFGSKGRSQSKGAGFQVRYIDDNMRMHKTRDGIWFIQTRVQN